jgi:hypothetical protein
MNAQLFRRIALASIAVTAALTAGAQGNAPSITAPTPPQFQQANGYPVTGRMICGDTQRAARFAQVTLIPTTNDSNGGGRRSAARTDLDGNFVVTNVPPGDYYVTGFLPGYVNQAQLVQAALNAGTDPSAALAGVPVVRVAAGGASTLLALQRGGVISGTVQWDDGTPAAGVGVSAQPATSGNTTAAQQLTNGRGFGGGNFFPGFAGTQTDDRGHFRLSGLAPGSYYIRATVQAPAPQRPDDRGFARTLSLSVYAPDKVRRTEATPLTVGAGEERSDLALVLGLAGMHVISGTVSSSAASVRSGSVNLTDQTDSTLNRTGTINSDGSFTIPYVPPGTYTLRVSASSALQTFGRGGNNNSDTTRFQPLQESITVTDGDLTGIAVTVTTATASQ